MYPAFAKEKEGISFEDIQRYVTPPPIFDMDKARKVVEIVKDQSKRYSALDIALSLYLYNRDNFLTESSVRQHLEKCSKITEKEIKAADPKNPLSTIGFEVESPRKPYVLSKRLDYAEFFDILGMSRNKVNGRNGVLDPEHLGAFWEFSPPPSYSAHVQERILSELIKGHFIPSLTDSYNPENILKYLDDKLVSLHINLGIPNWVKQEQYGNGIEYGDDLRLLGGAFSLAFSSGLRLKKRSQVAVLLKKSADSTPKTETEDGINQRVEIKALEVRDSRTYRLLTELQLISASVFAYLAPQSEYQYLSTQWELIKIEIKAVFNEYKIADPINFITSQREEASSLINDTKISKNLRKVLTRSANNIRYLLG